MYVDWTKCVETIFDACKTQCKELVRKALSDLDRQEFRQRLADYADLLTILHVVPKSVAVRIAEFDPSTEFILNLQGFNFKTLDAAKRYW